MLEKVQDWVLIIWLVLESGQFVESRVAWSSDPLFWPLWVALALVVVLSLKLFDVSHSLQSDRSNQED